MRITNGGGKERECVRGEGGIARIANCSGRNRFPLSADSRHSFLTLQFAFVSSCQARGSHISKSNSYVSPVSFVIF